MAHVLFHNRLPRDKSADSAVFTRDAVEPKLIQGRRCSLISAIPKRISPLACAPYFLSRLLEAWRQR